MVDRRTLFLSVLAVALGAAGAAIAEGLFRLIGIITNLSFYGRLDSSFISPAGNHFGLFVIAIPAIGGVLVGLMARYGSPGIRGHGIPEVMEEVLLNQSRIPPRLVYLKPTSSAISIGTGGPFGAEGPIIATGGALGSLVGQLLKTTAEERKILLSAGAAAGMAATFGSPVSAVLLAIELLLFEFGIRSLIPVAIASGMAAALRRELRGTTPIFAMHELWHPRLVHLLFYTALGAIVGVAAIVVTRAVYLIEDGFGKLPVHWMWWPALGGLVVGVAGYLVPDTLGVGYSNIEALLSGTYAVRTIVLLGGFKFISWAVALGSGTSGGTLAPLFTIGSALGAIIAEAVVLLFPHVGINVDIAALVGMAAMFAGASRTLLTSVVFAFETTLEPLGLLPLLAGCTAAYLVSSLLMTDTIMTEKIARRGILVPATYLPDPLAYMQVRDSATYRVAPLQGGTTVEQMRAFLTCRGPESRHHDFPVVNDRNEFIGIVTAVDLLDPKLPLTKTAGELAHSQSAAVHEDNSLRTAVDVMLREGVHRLAVTSLEEPHRLVAIISHSDILSAHRRRLREDESAERIIRWRLPRWRQGRAAEQSTQSANPRKQ